MFPLLPILRVAQTPIYIKKPLSFLSSCNLQYQSGKTAASGIFGFSVVQGKERAPSMAFAKSASHISMEVGQGTRSSALSISSSALETEVRLHLLNAMWDFIWGILGRRAKGKE